MTRMTPSEAFVDTLAARGVTELFGIVGSVAHDRNAAHMADRYPRAGFRAGPWRRRR